MAYEPPGGTLEPEEAILDGLRREVLEETGLTISDSELTGVYKNMKRGIVALVFRCTELTGRETPTDEVVELRWLTADEIRLVLDPAYAVRLLDALNAAPPPIRAHTTAWTSSTLRRVPNQCPRDVCHTLMAW